MMRQLRPANKKDIRGPTLLHSAAFHGSLSSITNLTQSGNFEIDELNQDRKTPLELAILQGHSKIVKHLLKKKAHVKTNFLHQAVCQGNINNIKLLLTSSSINARDSSSRTPLDLALEQGKVKVIKFLLKRGACTRTQNALQVASSKGYFDIIKLLIQMKWDPNKVTQKDTHTPLYLALAAGHYRTAFFLVQSNATIHTEEIDALLSSDISEDYRAYIQLLRQAVLRANDLLVFSQDTPLHLAVRLNHLDAIYFLLKQKEDINQLNIHFQTPLDCAMAPSASERQRDLIEYLLDNGANLNIQHYWGTPLYRAALMGDLEVVKLFLNRGALVNEPSKSVKQEMPLHAAVHTGSIAVTEYLLAAGAKVNVFNTTMQSPLLLAVLQETTETNVQLVQLLLRHGASVHVEAFTSGVTHTSLHAAINLSKHTLVATLLGAGASVHVKTQDNYQDLPLHCAATQGHWEIVKTLLRHGSDVNAHNRYHETPLLKAIANKHFSVAHLLIEKGAWIDQLDCRKESALHLAVVAGDQRLVERLLEMPGVCVGSVELQKFIARLCVIKQDEGLWKKMILAGLNTTPKMSSGLELDYFYWIKDNALKNSLETMLAGLNHECDRIDPLNENPSTLRLSFYCFKQLKENQRLQRGLSAEDVLNPRINKIYTHFYHPNSRLRQYYEAVFGPIETDAYTPRIQCI